MRTWRQPLPGYEWLIHQVWYLEVEKGEVIEPKPYLIPNPRAHLLITPDEQEYSYQASDSELSGSGSHLLCISDKLLLLDDTPPLKRIGITFKPHTATLLHQGASLELNACSWPDWLDELFPQSLRQRLLKLESKQEIAQAIQQHFDSLKMVSPQDKTFALVSRAIDLVENKPLIDIEALASECACSRRSLERAFKQLVGLSIKTYLQMMRLEQVILELHSSYEKVDWADFSQRYGFSDQSHLIRTLKQLMNKTPSAYLKRRDLTIDIYGDFE